MQGPVANDLACGRLRRLGLCLSIPPHKGQMTHRNVIFCKNRVGRDRCHTGPTDPVILITAM